MSALLVTRRAGLLGLGALALQGCMSTTPPPSAAASGLRFRAIKVDVSPIRASMGDPTAAWVEQALPGALAQALASHMAPPGDRNGATVVARIDYLYLGSSSGGPGFFNQTQDTIVGSLIVIGPRGVVVEKIPLRAITSYVPMAVDQALVERALQGRVTALAQAFAGWAPRELGLS